MSVHRRIEKTAAEKALAEQFAGLASPDAGRAAAFERFLQRGLPTRRDEAWHYTDLRAQQQTAAAPSGAPDGARIAQARALLAGLARIGEIRFVLVDGRFIAELSDAPPARVAAAALTRPASGAGDDAIVALNEAFAVGGLSLRVEAGAVIRQTLEIVHVGRSDVPAAGFSQVEITLGEGAAAEAVERFVGAGAGYQRNALIRAALGDSARAKIVTMLEDVAALHLETQSATLGANAEYAGFALVAGGALVRRQLFVRQQGDGAAIALSGLSLLDGQRHADTTLVVEHGAPHGRSREYFKHIVADEATGVYQGKVIVEPYAQKTDGAMKSQAILLSPTASMNNKPELEIFADDVVCGHGATVGALDPEQIFYAQARGLPRAQAEAMLLEAFGAEAIERVDNAAVADALRERLRAWLARRGR